tara:strand:- start:613 stop:831 length:219 start_codon:yes stop_codon:yes gene_type:complete
MSKKLSEIINQPIPGLEKVEVDPRKYPKYETMQEVKTDMRLEQVVSMLHEIKGELHDVHEILDHLTGPDYKD